MAGKCKVLRNLVTIRYPYLVMTMTDKQKILKLIEEMLANPTLAQFLKTYDFSLNLYGLQISDSRHHFVRISCPQTESVLWMQEEYIPKKDDKGNWIEFPPIESPRVERISPAEGYIPFNLTYEKFLNNLRGFFDELKRYGGSHLKQGDPKYFEDDLKRVRQSIPTIG